MSATPAEDFSIDYHVPAWVKDEPKIFKALADVNRKLEGITKDRVNTDQKFRFRGIDDVYNMLHPLLAAAGLITPPIVLDRIDGERATRNGGSMAHVKLKVRYKFIAEDGSSLTVGPVWGEALDTSDKASNKALAFAQKYIMLQTFTIPTEDTRETLEEREGDQRSTETTGPMRGESASTGQQGSGQSAPPHVIMLQKFSAIGIGRSHLEKRWGKRVEEFAEKDLDDAREIYRQICEQPHQRAQLFEPPFGQPQAPQQRPAASPGQRLNQRGGAR